MLAVGVDAPDEVVAVLVRVAVARGDALAQAAVLAEREHLGAPRRARRAAVPSVEPSSTTSTSHAGKPGAQLVEDGREVVLLVQRRDEDECCSSAIARTLDHVVLRSWCGAREALRGERRDVDERLAAEDEVAHDLADRGRLQEAVPGEAGRVEEARRRSAPRRRARCGRA